MLPCIEAPLLQSWLAVIWFLSILLPAVKFLFFAVPDGPKLEHSVSKYLPAIAARLKYNGKLYLCHRLDMAVTGVLLLAKWVMSMRLLTRSRLLISQWFINATTLIVHWIATASISPVMRSFVAFEKIFVCLHMCLFSVWVGLWWWYSDCGLGIGETHNTYPVLYFHYLVSLIKNRY